MCVMLSTVVKVNNGGQQEDTDSPSMFVSAQILILKKGVGTRAQW